MLKDHLKYLTLISLLILTSCNQQTTPGSDLTINTKILPNWESGRPATFAIAVSGGAPPYLYAVEGALPNGFNLGPAGVIGGSYILPSGTSQFVSPIFTIVVTDATGAQARQALSITIVEPSIRINTLVANCIVNQRCNAPLATAAGGNPPYTFQSDTFAENAPPMGMIVDVNGNILGTSKRLGRFNVGVCAKDTNGNSKCGVATVVVGQGNMNGTWEGNYSETEYSSGCQNKNEGTLIWIITSTGESFTGTVEDSGTTISSTCEGAEYGSFTTSGTVTGTVKEGSIQGTMGLEGAGGTFRLPVTGKWEGTTITGTYTGTGTFSGGFSTTYSGSFILEKES